jgi:quinol monooxygenase YgiN
MTKAYTLATYRVIPGKEDAFIKAWRDLANTFSALTSPPYWGSLIRSQTERNVFHSFGPWKNASDVAAMRNNSEAAAAFQAIRALCQDMTPGDYELVVHVKVRDETEDFAA